MTYKISIHFTDLGRRRTFKGTHGPRQANRVIREYEAYLLADFISEGEYHYRRTNVETEVQERAVINRATKRITWERVGVREYSIFPLD